MRDKCRYCCKDTQVKMLIVGSIAYKFCDDCGKEMKMLINDKPICLYDLYSRERKIVASVVYMDFSALQK
jgi:hypothetical protein